MILTWLFWNNLTMKKASITSDHRHNLSCLVHWHQSYKSGRAFRIEFWPKVDKISSLIRAWD